jgi:hypothetical protein
LPAENQPGEDEQVLGPLPGAERHDEFAHGDVIMSAV